MRKRMTPIEWAKWTKLRILKATVCRALGHKRTRTTDILGCCARCYTDVPQSDEDREILLKAWKKDDNA